VFFGIILDFGIHRLLDYITLWYYSITNTIGNFDNFNEKFAKNIVYKGELTNDKKLQFDFNINERATQKFDVRSDYCDSPFHRSCVGAAGGIAVAGSCDSTHHQHHRQSDRH
jgi:hypothetical protein